MVDTGAHIPRAMLARLVDGSLHDAAVEPIVIHLGECEQCLALVDELWPSQAPAAFAMPVVDLDPETARRVEQRLVRRIHTANLAAAMFRLGTQGVFRSFLALLSPLSREPARPKSNGANHD